MKQFYKNSALCAAAVSLLLFAIGWKTKPAINLGEFIKEITIINVSGTRTQSAIWLPFEFNENAIGKNAESSDIAELKSYLIFMVHCSIDRQDRHINASAEQVQQRAVLLGAGGRSQKPLQKVPDKLAAKLEAIKQAISGSDNQKAMQMLVFNLNGSDGECMIDSSKRGKLALQLKAAGLFGGTEFIWHTPFDAIIDAGNCPKCGEKIKAKWHYCPWCGNKL